MPNHRLLENLTCLLVPSRPKKCFVFERDKKTFPKTSLVLLAGKFEGAVSGDKYEVLYRTVYIDSALVGQQACPIFQWSMAKHSAESPIAGWGGSARCWVGEG